jgi:hypothetical protein
MPRSSAFDDALRPASSSSSSAGAASSSSASSIVGSDSVRPAVVTLQEMRASRGFIASRAHYVGVPAL